MFFKRLFWNISYFYIQSSFDPDGLGELLLLLLKDLHRLLRIDIFFLNRQSMRHVKSSEELIPIFAVPPAGE